MQNNDYIAFIVEGDDREPQIIENISKVFFSHHNFKIISLPAGKNIYMLWNQLKRDNFETDIIEVVRESNVQSKDALKGLSRDDFSSVYLLFDFDPHQKNTERNLTEDIIKQMLESFDNETENGKLYISYPMIEALRDFTDSTCGNGIDCYVPIDQITNYKHKTAEKSAAPHFKKYDFALWKLVIDIFAMKLSCLFGYSHKIEFETYRKKISTIKIYERELQLLKTKGVFVLSSLPGLILDYFDEKFWNKTVSNSQLKIQNCLSDKMNNDNLNSQI